MSEIIHAGCKVNLCLAITGRRHDGYHTLESVFWPLPEPYDVLTCTLREEQGMTVSCKSSQGSEGIHPTHNTLTRAYTAFVEAGGRVAGVHIDLHKGIPLGAGLGGGSSDAAAVLSWCQRHATQALSPQNLAAAALRVGADVPFFLHAAPAIVRGIGEEIQLCPPFLHGKTLVLLCPTLHIATPWAYAAWDAAHAQATERCRKKNIFPKECLTSTPQKYKYIFALVQQCSNDFEEVVFAAYPQLRTYKEALLAQGAEIAVMSGSGASIVGIFANLKQGQKAANAMQHTGCRIFTVPI